MDSRTGHDAGQRTLPPSDESFLPTVGVEMTASGAEALAASLRRSAQFATLVDEAPVGVILVDAAMQVLEVNPAALRAFDAGPELDGGDFRRILRRQWNPGYAEEVIARFEQTLRTGARFHAPERAEVRADRKTVEAYDWQVSRIPLPDGSFGAVCYFRDITSQVRTRQRLEVADRQKDEFLAMLAHELRNPLASIRTASELLKRVPPGDARAGQAGDIVRRQARHLTRLVDDLLDISRITRGRIELKRQDIDLVDVVTQALEIVEPAARAKSHVIEADVGSRPLPVNGDPARLVQSLSNLLSNAVKYTDREGHIRVACHADGDAAVVRVTDDGTGIPQALLPQVFDLFVQSDRTLDRAEGGLGIGLSVVKRLVEMHGGTVAADSAGPGRGSTFTIRLPRIDRPVHRVSAADTPPKGVHRVLVVDDNRDAAQSLAALMSMDGHQVEVAFCAEEALQRFGTFRPDVVLLDIGLPGMDGYEVARRVRAMPDGAATRLVAVTGYGRAEDRRRALDSGFDDHLVKPVEPEGLHRALAAPPRQ